MSNADIFDRFSIRLKASCLLVAVCLILLCTGSTLHAQDIGVRADLSSATITHDESVVLTITAFGLDAELDASSLDADFEVLGRSSSRQVETVLSADNQLVNTSVVTWALELLPKSQGVFTVPAVKVGSYETQLLTLTVNDVPQGAKRDVFLEASVDTTSPWVQSQVVMTLRVFQAIEIVDGGLDIPSANDLVVERIGEDTVTRQTHDGREYNVTERRFALFPQKSGTIIIDPIRLSVTVPAQPDRARGFFSPTRKLTRRSDAITLNVQPRPDSSAAWWLPASKVSVQSQWQGDVSTVEVDQPLTRTIALRVEGVVESQLPDINIPAIDGLSLYAEDPKRVMGVADSGLVSEQRVNWALIPQRAGTLTLPAIRIEWFNTQTQQVEFAELPEETLTVVPSTAAVPTTDTAPVDKMLNGGSNIDYAATAGVNEPDPAKDAQIPLQDSGNAPSLSSGDESAAAPTSTGTSQVADSLLRAQLSKLQSSLLWWRVFALLASGLLLLTLSLLLLSKGRSADSDSTRGVKGNKKRKVDANGVSNRKIASLRLVETACSGGDLLDVKRTLLDWAAEQWPQSPPTSIDGIQTKLSKGDARDKLGLLMSALYSKQGSTDNMPSLAKDHLVNLPRELKAAMLQEGAQAEISGTAGNVDSLWGRKSKLPQL